MATKKAGVISAGLWFLNWQMIWLGTAVCAFWLITQPILGALCLTVGVMLSRVGLWGFDLCAQLVIQEGVEPEYRGSFSSMEASFQNFFELLSFAATVVFSHPADFRYPVVMSWVAVLGAGILYADFVWKRRGHLLHVSDLIKRMEHKFGGGMEPAEAQVILLS
ncbi:MAG: hypothetical protein M1816_007135 [Peltula sp. TS41687]|nr:MAG: hypothetical protein M1816_007135 [Peltula sp. TS41687]